MNFYSKAFQLIYNHNGANKRELYILLKYILTTYYSQWKDKLGINQNDIDSLLNQDEKSFIQNKINEITKQEELNSCSFLENVLLDQIISHGLFQDKVSENLNVEEYKNYLKNFANKNTKLIQSSTMTENVWNPIQFIKSGIQNKLVSISKNTKILFQTEKDKISNLFRNFDWEIEYIDYEPWMDNFMKVMGRDMEKRIEYISQWTKKNFDRNSLLFDHQVFTILKQYIKDKSNSKVLDIPDFYAKSALETELNDLKYLFLFNIWAKKQVLDQDNAKLCTDSKLVHSIQMPLETWKKENLEEYKHWENQWDRFILESKDIKDKIKSLSCVVEMKLYESKNINSELDSNPKPNSKMMKMDVSVFSLITKFISFFSSPLESDFWNVMISVYHWFHRPHFSGSKHIIYADFPMELKSKFPDEANQWDLINQKSMLNDHLYLCLERYGFGDFTDYVFYDLNKNYHLHSHSHSQVQFSNNTNLENRLDYIEIQNLVKSNPKLKSQNASKIENSTINRIECLFGKWIDPKLFPLYNSRFASWIWSIYGDRINKLQKGEISSRIANGPKSIEFNRNLYTQYSESWMTKKLENESLTLVIKPPYYIEMDSKLKFDQLLQDYFFLKILELYFPKSQSSTSSAAPSTITTITASNEFGFDSIWSSYPTFISITLRDEFQKLVYRVFNMKKEFEILYTTTNSYQDWVNLVKSKIDLALVEWLVYFCRNNHKFCLDETKLSQYILLKKSPTAPCLNFANDQFNLYLVNEWKKLVGESWYISLVGHLKPEIHFIEPSSNIIHLISFFK